MSGGDAGYLINTHRNVIIAQSGTKQFLYLRTAQTPSSVDAAKLNADQNNRVAVLLGAGSSFPAAAAQAAKETAGKYHLAYYEGANGDFHRVDPKH